MQIGIGCIDDLCVTMVLTKRKKKNYEKTRPKKHFSFPLYLEIM